MLGPPNAYATSLADSSPPSDTYATSERDTHVVT